MVMVEEMDFVGSETDVAVTVTVLPVGMAEGAVKTTSGTVGLVWPKVPHAPWLPHVTVQVTWAFDALLAAAPNVVKMPMLRVDGGAVDQETETAGGC